MYLRVPCMMLYASGVPDDVAALRLGSAWAPRSSADELVQHGRFYNA